MPDEIPELVGHRELALLDPVLNQVHLVLLDDWSSELNGLDGVQFGGLQQRVEVDQEWGRSSSLWQVLELVDGLLVSKESTRGVSGNSGGTSIIAGSKLLVEKKHKHLIGTWEVESLGEFEGKGLVVGNVPG